MNTYRQMLNMHANSRINKFINRPDRHLFIGDNENLSPVNNYTLDGMAISNEIYANMQSISQYSNDEIADMIANNLLETNDINYNVALMNVKL